MVLATVWKDLSTRGLCSLVGSVKFYNDSSEVDYPKKETLEDLKDNVNYYTELIQTDSSKKNLIRYYFSEFQFFQKIVEDATIDKEKTDAIKQRDESWEHYLRLIEPKPRNHFI